MTDAPGGPGGEDKLDALLRDLAKEYHEPPPTPKAELWQRIAAARQAVGRPGGRTVEPRDVIPLRRPSSQPLPYPVRVLLGVAALLLIGIAIGRLTAPGIRPAAPSPAASRVAAEGGAAGANLAVRLVTAQHLGQVEAFLTEFGSRQAAQELPGQAKELLGTTRLLLDSQRITDVATRKLLEDLELILVQIVALTPSAGDDELDFIHDGLAQQQLRTRLRNAIPAGPAIRM